MILLALSLFFAEPAPLEMPRATAYLVKEDGVSRLEDRFDVYELWLSQTVDGRWFDDDDRMFTLSSLRTLPPVRGEGESLVSRSAFAKNEHLVNHKEVAEVRSVIELLSPVAISEKGRPPRQLPRGYKDVRYWQGTNQSAIVCAFLPLKSHIWRLATWQLAADDDFGEQLNCFEDEFLAKNGWQSAKSIESLPSKTSEREFLRRDAKHSVAAYDCWRATDGDEFSVIDDLGPNYQDFIITLTNDFKTMRARYHELVPAPLSASNTLAVARIFADRDEYLDALEIYGITNMTWSAAYWCSARRELVAYLPYSDSEKLTETLRHEAFHQYLSYALAMQSAPPWLNEGYAQYFEDEATARKRSGMDEFSVDELKAMSKFVASVMMMDYARFYDGDNAARHLKYNLALSIAVFLEQGAAKVRFNPFAKLKSRCLDKILAGEDMAAATLSAFENADQLKLFAAEWLKFYTNR